MKISIKEQILNLLKKSWNVSIELEVCGMLSWPAQAIFLLNSTDKVAALSFCDDKSLVVYLLWDRVCFGNEYILDQNGFFFLNGYRGKRMGDEILF